MHESSEVGTIRDLKVIKNLKGIWYYNRSSSWDSSEFERDSYSLYVIIIYIAGPV